MGRLLHHRRVMTDEKCAEAYDGGTHHLVPKRDGMVMGKQALSVQTCLFCGVTYRFGLYWTPDTTDEELTPYRKRRDTSIR